jgi:hypothetical protein
MVLTKEVGMTSIVDGSMKIQTTSESNPSTPAWFGEVVLLSSFLRKHGVLSKISEQVRFARRRFGRYEMIDFLAVLFGYAISGERTLEEFYERLQPFAVPFMALFERDQLPSRSALSRFLDALTEAPVEALRTLFLDDLLSRPSISGANEKQTGSLVDRAGNEWTVIDLDGTREAARQRALPQTNDLPPASRRLDEVCAPGYTGRKRGEVVRTRTTISQAHSYHWLGSFGNRGNGRYREELHKGLAAITRYLSAYQLPSERTLLRLDGLYGTGAVLADLAGFAFVTRGKEYTALDHPLVQARLHLPPDQYQQRPESQTARTLYDCPEIPVGPQGVLCRVVVATHPATKKKSPVGVTRAGIVYELFLTNLPQHAFTACDVVELYLHRGAFEPILADEDREQDPDRWCSHAAWGQEAQAGWLPNGSGTSASNWGMCFRRLRCASPSLLLLSQNRVPRLPHVRLHLLLPLGMAHLRLPPPGKLVDSQGKTFFPNLMARSVVQQGRSFVPMSGVEKPMGVYGWCTPPASVLVVPVRCATSANGMGPPPRNRVR